MATETTLKEVGEMLTHVVEHMTTKEDVARLDKGLDDLKTEMIDQFESADKQFLATHDRQRDIAAEITVIHRRVERLEELGVSAITQFDGPVCRAFEGRVWSADGAEPARLPNSRSRTL
jgi:hypothetical protein